MSDFGEVKDEAFKAIKDSIPPEFEDPTEEQQKAIDALDRRTGFNPNRSKSKSKPGNKQNRNHRSRK